ncbi:unnamed protein product [Dovyalis caffra]|uniref:Uncharacterized protein n=1 Tax=Dovyalis caffra TaxID=77055 RepID=A0AAV1RA99_9ROSI|nr:unnamed protein product [Dovyalis caffra]
MDDREEWSERDQKRKSLLTYVENGILKMKEKEKEKEIWKWPKASRHPTLKTEMILELVWRERALFRRGHVGAIIE